MSNQLLNLNPENITIIFTAYNVVDHLKLAIYSFLEYYPTFKKSIVVFDDNSTDNTAGWCKEFGLSVITWLSKHRYFGNMTLEKMDEFRFRRNYHKCAGAGMSYRNSVMISSALEQVKTKYVMINDADILFMKTGFMESYDIMLHECDVIVPFERYDFKWNHSKFVKQNKEQVLDRILGKYKSLLKYDVASDKEHMLRGHFFHSIINLDVTKSKGLLFDNYNNELFLDLIYRNSTLDTGSDFFIELLNNNVKICNIESFVFNKIFIAQNVYTPVRDWDIQDKFVYHFRWISSFKRTNKDSFTDPLNPVIKIKADLMCSSILKNRMLEVCDKYNIDLTKGYLC